VGSFANTSTSPFPLIQIGELEDDKSGICGEVIVIVADVGQPLYVIDGDREIDIALPNS